MLSRFFFLFSLIIVVVIVVSHFHVVVINAFYIAPINNNNSISYNLVSTPETTFVQLKVIQNCPSKQFTNTSSSDGYYATLIDFSKNRTYFIWEIEGKPVCTSSCRAYPCTPTKFPSNTENGCTIQSGNKQENILRYVTSRYQNAFSFSFPEGILKQIVSGQSGIHQRVYDFKNSTTQEEIDFLDKIPEIYCKNVKCNPIQPPAAAAETTSASFHSSPLLHRSLHSPFSSKYSEIPPNFIPTEENFQINEKHLKLLYELMLKNPTTSMSSVDNRKFSSMTRDQSSCGGCYSFSAAAVAEIVYYKKLNYLTKKVYNESFSVQNLIDCVHDMDRSDRAPVVTKGCINGWPLTSLQFVLKNGIVREEDYHFTDTNGRYCKVNNENHINENNENNVKPMRKFFPFTHSASMLPSPKQIGLNKVEELMMTAVRNFGAITTIINIIPSLAGISDGMSSVYSDSECVPAPAHAVTIVGYGVVDDNENKQNKMKYWIVKNSWSSLWATDGYFLVERGANMCGIESYVFSAN